MGFRRVGTPMSKPGGFKALMAGKPESEIEFPEEIQRNQTIAILWGAIWHRVKAYHKTLKFVVPDVKSGRGIESTNAHIFMQPFEGENGAKEQLKELETDGEPMLKLLTTLGCSHVICLRDFNDTKPTWTAGFHAVTPNAYVYDLGSGQAGGFEGKNRLDQDSKFNYWEMAKDEAKEDCENCTSAGFRQKETMEAVAARIAETLVAVHKKDTARQIILRGTGKHRDHTEIFGELMGMVQKEVSLRTREKYTQFTNIFDGKLLTPDEEALFGSMSLCGILGPEIIKVESANLKTMLSIESGKGSTQYGFQTRLERRRRMAQREFSSRRDSPVMTRLLKEIVRANQ